MYPKPQPVPPIDPVQISPGITYVRPLTRRGVGPGIVVLVPHHAASIQGDIEDGIPSVRMKWAEEGYSVVEVRPEAWEQEKLSHPLAKAIETFASREECQPKEKPGLVCHDVSQWERASEFFKRKDNRFVGAVLYGDRASFSQNAKYAAIPTMFHLTGKDEVELTRSPDRPIHEYPSIENQHFSLPFQKDFHYASESVSHSRNLSFLKPLMGGPYFDLETIWDEHTFYEFGDRSVENAMMTMVQEPYVNHIPTLTGGIGREKLTEFYRDRFIFSNPKDSELELISRTVGIDRIVDEFIFKVTFDRPIHWLLPGVPPTNKYIEVPMMAVVNIRGDRLYHEHINWDSATALRMIGALPKSVSLELPVETHTNGTDVKGKGPVTKQVEVRLPIADGNDAAKKMRDKNAVESNQMLGSDWRT